jgi:hypothetical protein
MMQVLLRVVWLAVLLVGLFALGSWLPQDLTTLIRPGTLMMLTLLCQTALGFALAIMVDRLPDRTERGSLLWICWAAAAVPWVGPTVGFWLSPLLFVFLFSPVLVWAWLVRSLIKRKQWQALRFGGLGLLASTLGTAAWLRGVDL